MFNFVAFWFTFSFSSYFKSAGKGGCAFSTSSSDLGDVAGYKKGTEDKKNECKKLIDTQFRDSWVSMRQRTPMMRKS